MTTIDQQGNAHRSAGAPDGGQFAGKVNTAPAGTLADEPDEPAIERGREWRILADRLPELAAAVKKANARLERAGIAERFTYETVTTTWRDEHDRVWLVADVTLNRPAITHGDWRFAGAHQATLNGGVISHWVGEDAAGRPEVADMRCDHCGKTRSRGQVYTVRNAKTGETKQIGKSCLQLFLGMKPEGLWALSAEVGAELEWTEPVEHDGPRESNAYAGDELLLATIRQVDQDGWVSRRDATWQTLATIDKVTDTFTQLTSAPPTAEEQAEIDAIIRWASELDTDDNEYLANLKAALTPGEHGDIGVHRKHAAIAASAVASYRREQQRQREKAEREKRNAGKAKAYLAAPGEKLKGRGVTATVLSVREGYDYGYGAPTHVTLIDDAGHVLYWKASAGSLELSKIGEEGQRVVIAGGTVKDNRVSDFNGDWETVLTRVQLEPAPDQE